MEINKKGGALTLVIMVVMTLLAIVSLVGYYWVKDSLKTDNGAKIFSSNLLMSVAQKGVEQKFGDLAGEFVAIVPKLSGIEKPMTYLVLFLNNTEMRPGGGFIGSYAVVKVEKGKINILKVEGAETLDRGTPDTWRPEAPAILREHLGVSRWYFRDANWSPDFSIGAVKALEFYRGEGGEYADSIDGVVGVTTDVFASLLSVTGPVVVGGIEFDAENAVEKLEYEVEYGYADKGTDKADRKDIMQPLTLMIVDKLGGDWTKIITKVWPLFLELSAEKHLFAYFPDQDLQAKIENIGLAGRVGSLSDGSDALLWVDANLAALKTDHAIKRTLDYSLEKVNGEWHARAAMRYTNTGKFDWRTTRYRTYARIFVPEGSKFLRGEGSMKWDRTNEAGMYDSGVELNRSWFGAFISVEPGDTKTLVFEYVLPPSIGEKIATGSYVLSIEKQNGLPELGLTLNLKFDRNIVKATPGEDISKYGDEIYEFTTTTLRRDLVVGVGF